MAGYSGYYSAPTTQQAVVTVNAGLDRLFCNWRKGVDGSMLHPALVTSDDHSYSVAQRELCFLLKDKHDKMINRPSCNGVNDMALKVFSSANNLKKPPAHDKGAQGALKARNQLRDMFTFVGVATTPLDYTNTNNKDTLALQIGGSVTIFNTGTSTIRPGQRIIWDVPPLDMATMNSRKRGIRGEPQSKRLFMVMPLEEALSDSRASMPDGSNDFTSLLHAVHPHVGPVGTEETEESTYLRSLYQKVVGDDARNNPVVEAKALQEYNRAILHMYNEVLSRVIGIALSGAGAGDPFDIMLCSAH